LSVTAIALVLAAAIAHASWNLFGKQAAATGAAFFIWLLAIGVTGIYLPVVAVAAFVTQPRLAGLNWLFLAGTGVLHAGYFLFLQLGYRLSDLSVGYPIGRGTGAMLAALAGILLLGERPSLIGGAGILAIVGGVVAIGLPQRATGTARVGPATADPPQPQTPRPSAAGPIAFALVTGVFIACYTVWDKYAVANLHTEPVLQGYAAFPVMALVFTPFVLRDTLQLEHVWKAFRPQVIGAALLSPLAYILVLIALSFTAVSAVAPAREVSVLFGVLLGRRMLGEDHIARRLVAAAAIVAGIIAVALG
jgi:drug/metabolite transporter (DMT)-like permease